MVLRQAKTLPKIEADLWDFYAPTFRILVSGQDLLTQLHLEIASVEVDNALGKADQFSFVVNNGFDTESREFGVRGGKTLIDVFEFGAPVEVYMGYVDRKDTELMVGGTISSVTTSFLAQGLPQITVRGYDRSYALMKSVGSKNFGETTDDAAVKLVAGSHNLTPKVDATSPKKLVEKNQESDFQFVQRLAERNGFEFFVKDKELHFVKPDNDESGILELEWGMGLLTFSPEANVVEQVKAVEVRSWDPKKKEEIVGIARVGDIPGRGRGEKAGADFGKSHPGESVIRVRRPVSSKKEAEQCAAALLKRRAEGFVRGSGETIGIPWLRAGKNVHLKGLGERFSRDYFLEQCTHKITTAGYKTTIKVKDTSL